MRTSLRRERRAPGPGSGRRRPAGMTDNSPRLQPWVNGAEQPSPGGAAERFTQGVSAVPAGLGQCGARVPALKRRAILACPFGTGRGVGDAARKKGFEQQENDDCRQNLVLPVPDPNYTVRAWRVVVSYLLRRQEFLYE